MLNFGDRCTISRPIKQANVYGSGKIVSAHEYIDIPCRLKTDSVRSQNSLTAEFITQTVTELYLGKFVDIRPNDTIKAIQLEGEQELHHTTYKVEAVIAKRGRFLNYQLATLQRIS